MVKEVAFVPPDARGNAEPKESAFKNEVPVVAVRVPTFKEPNIVVVERIEVDDA